MFSIQSPSQALYALSSQLSFNLSHKRTIGNKHPRVAANISTCSPAFISIVNQLDLNCEHLPEILNDRLTCLIAIFPKRERTHWNRSYISGNSFSETRNCVEDNLHRNINFRLSSFSAKSHHLLHNFAMKCRSPLVEQTRSFRTVRKTPEADRSPDLVSRIKQMLPQDRSPFERDFLFSSPRDVFKDAENLPENEGKKVKLAFAEGYAAGQGKSPNAVVKFLKAIQNFAIISLIVAAVVVIVAAANGTVFKLQLGNQVEIDAQEIDITFADVKGVDEAKQELNEIVEFLKNPGKFSSLGGKLPKGVLLVGPPGTGKTLLARAVAGEAGVPFFFAAGSEFDEILVGQGARRVRDLFAAAKNRAPCVIFIDEIDAVGSKRTNSVLHPYANQTINQLLSEMDGFHQNEGVIVLGATNRRDDLDRALLRPGRFDVEVVVQVPDLEGRKDILKLYLGKIQCRDINVDVLARGTTGFTGADLENMVNLAAIRAAVDSKKFVSMKDLENARDKVLMGPARKTRLPDEEANEITAYHEGGHAVVAYFTKDCNPIHKVTIIPRGSSLGHTAYIPKKERYHTTKSELLASMDTMMGGRAAEELIFGSEKITSGAASDLQQATAIATHMVKEWGMSEKLGLRTFKSNEGSFIQVNELSPAQTEAIDAEIKKILNESYERAKNILKTHAKEHKLIAEALLKYETLEADDIKAIMLSKKEISSKSLL